MFSMTTKATTASAQPYQQLMVLFSSYVVALREQEFSAEVQMRILSKTSAALTQIYTTEVLSKPRKRQGVYRAASTPSNSRKVPADQRVQFSTEEVKKLNYLNEQIGSKLYSEGITTEQFMNSLAKDGRATFVNLKAGLDKLKLKTFSSGDMELLLRKYNALLDANGKINYSEFSHLFPKRQLDQLAEEDMKEETEVTPNVTAERKDRGKPKRAFTSYPFPQTMQLKNEDDSETSKSGQDQDDMSEEDDLEEEPGQTPPREFDES